MNGERALRKRCRRLAESLPMPAPFDLGRFLEMIGDQRRRPIEVVPVSAAADVPCGLLLSTVANDYIFVPRNTTVLHRQHIVFHEIAHLLCEHVGDTTMPATVLPGLSRELIMRVLGRTGYVEPEEREAELVATFLSQRVDQRPRPTYAGELQALDDAFGEGRR